MDTNHIINHSAPPAGYKTLSDLAEELVSKAQKERGCQQGTLQSPSELKPQRNEVLLVLGPLRDRSPRSLVDPLIKLKEAQRIEPYYIHQSKAYYSPADQAVLSKELEDYCRKLRAKK